MKRVLIIIFFALNSSLLFAQIPLTIEGTLINNTLSGNWAGVNIPRSVPTIFTYRNNFITSVNTEGYMLQAGDESPLSTNNNLDREVITGNKFIWNGANAPSIITHGLFVGYNSNSIVKYNYLDKVPYGIVFKSGTDTGVNMTFTSGGCAYNIWKNGKFAGRVKGINGVKFYNNTFYSGDGSGWYLLLITANMDRAVQSPSIDTKIFNNIFYSTIQIPMIKIESGCLTNFESDYNVYWCSAGEPTFNIDGVTLTWAQWKAHGYDTHSIIVNPNFINTIDFIPAARLDYGKNLGADWEAGLSTTAAWVIGSSPTTTNQNGTWQVGARIYDASSIDPYYISSVVENITPAILEITYSLSLANIVTAASAFNIRVNSVSRTVNSVAIVGDKVRLTLSSPIVYGDIITIAYSKPASNPLQTASGGQAASITSQSVVNNCINANPAVIITSPGNLSLFAAPATITIKANASDVDGAISKVEFYNGSTKLGEKAAAPYSFIWNNMAVGSYSLTVVATDNFNAKTTSSSISISVINSTTTVNQPPVVKISNPRKGNKYENLSTITIDAVASDPDGTINKVEFYSSAVKFVELTSAPYSYTWKDVEVGAYSITAIATDNLNATTTSSPIEFEVMSTSKYDANSEILNLYPNPNNGHFSIEFVNPLQNGKSEVVITDLAGKQVYIGPASKEETLKQFDLSYLDSGIYILMIVGKEILITKKFIKN
jgi:Bacterial Ig domain/Secretion system C-terminal sorting domain/Putative flagellar system-associated repeat